MKELFECFELFRPTSDEKTYVCRDNTFMNVYHNADSLEFTSWLEKMKSNGFEKLQENELNENIFVQFSGKVSVCAHYTPCDRTVRIIVTDDMNIPCLMPQECRNECQTTFYMLENDHTIIDCGMCLLIQCADYSFFVVDSGHYFQFNDNDRIYRFMRDRTPKGRRVIVAGWLITHSHTDHVSKLMDFLKYNCEDVDIEAFYYNLLPSDYYIDAWDIEELTFNEKLDVMLKGFNAAKKVKLHAGERFYVRNLMFDVLCTHEEIYPKEITDFNDTSCAVMLTAENTRIFIPGDASACSSEVLEREYGESLECDIVQVAHHGHNGLSAYAYELLNAPLLLFPITRIKFDEEYPRIEANRFAVDICDEYHISSDGTIKVPLPYVAGNVEKLPDETFEDFAKIKRQWGYDYTDERKRELYRIFIENGGDPEKLILPVNYKGYSIF